MTSPQLLTHIHRTAARNLRTLRLRHHLTQESLSAALPAYSQSTLSMLEQNRRPFTLNALADFAVYFQVPLAAFMLREL